MPCACARISRDRGLPNRASPLRSFQIKKDFSGLTSNEIEKSPEILHKNVISKYFAFVNVNYIFVAPDAIKSDIAQNLAGINSFCQGSDAHLLLCHSFFMR